jgi:hypothetical protein
MATKEQELDQVLADLRDLKSQLAVLKGQQDSLASARAQQYGRIVSKLDSVDDWTNFVKCLDDIPGLRSPAWYRVNIPFEYGSSQSISGSTQISPTGPFVCKQIQMYYQITDTDSSHYPPVDPGLPGVPPTYFTSNAAGRTMLANSYIATMNELSRSNYPLALTTQWTYIGPTFSSYNNGLQVNRGVGWNYPEFDVQIEIAGSNRFWTGNQTIPAAAFYGLYNPLFENFEGWVENTDSFVVHAKPSTPTVNLQGVFIAEFHGYHINSHVDVKSLLGY